MGYAEEAARVLAEVGDGLPVEEIMAVIQSLDNAKMGIQQAGEKYTALFGSQLQGVQDGLVTQIGIMQNVRDELTNEAARLLGGGA